MVARIPDHPIFLEILKKIELPLAAPSANTSGSVSPTNAEMVEMNLGNKISGIVDGGNCKVGVESTIVDARDERKIFILRQGKIGADEIKDVLPSAEILADTSGTVVPGKKYKHYAPAHSDHCSERYCLCFCE